jgi:hypothetical protein
LTGAPSTIKWNEPSAIAIDGFIYLFAGDDRYGRPLVAAERYDIKNGKMLSSLQLWSFSCPAPFPLSHVKLSEVTSAIKGTASSATRAMELPTELL